MEGIEEMRSYGAAAIRRWLETTRSAASEFEHAITHANDPCPADIDPLLWRAHFDGMRSVVRDLRQEATRLEAALYHAD